MSRPLDQDEALQAFRSACLREARRYSADEADAQDAVQEALLRAWRHRERCRDPDAPLAWLLAITRNEARRRPRAQREVLGEAGDPTDPLAAEEIARAGTRADVARALRCLTAPERRLLGLRYALDLTNAEVALEVGVEEGTVRVQLHRARRRLRAMMAA
jgi:RNA polymerase sigma-70 factor (ECF subfamily)